MADLDLFGDPVESASTPSSTPDLTPVNDMDLIEAVLTNVIAAGYHLGGVNEKVYRCEDSRVEPVPAYEDTAVHQLINAKFIEVTNPRACPFAVGWVDDHGRALRLTKRGHAAHSRWCAYKRIPTVRTEQTK